MWAVQPPTPRGYACGLKQRYEIDLAGAVPSPAPDPGLPIRTVTEADLAGIARLMLDAYVNTIDYEGEDLEDAVEEVRSFLEDQDSLLDRSYVMEDAGRIVAGVLLAMSEGEPVVMYVMTVPAHKRRGLGRRLVAHALDRLAADGHDRVALYITVGNTPSEALFRSLGAVPA